MRRYKRPIKRLLEGFNDNDRFLSGINQFVQIIAKLLSIGILFIIGMTVYEVGHYMFVELHQQIFAPPRTNIADNPDQVKQFGRTLFTIFGLFLNVLIAIEILENITAYLQKHVLQVELVIVTSLIAVARKIIILDLEKTAGLDLAALACTIFALAAAYWVVLQVNHDRTGTH
ncbi:phosphate-starvation-inducible PsiE family protein [filamentous cyanobacterium LEGE 11480]|uniref:Phosphate-starvation-inducible PsiE family protein n=1 Tax=Romeriopsis navalis LEGE 11480 TaxID=2777977 RepID=A0A928VU03_9CYAN|nr:phosphate-starvation-inducible PsiE family protein [Romeriopsis navalis]MBE9032034.1 phosphate-starvation-inducible PsiE family protein [Romeriopsis navalis LEGE 11480]